MSIIKTNNLTKSYGKNRGIKNISLTINKGEIFGFVGPNGAGKSTTIRTLLNFIYPTSGEAKIFDLDIVKETSEIKSNVGYVPSEVKYYEDVKVKEIIKYAESFYTNVDKEYVENLCALLEVDLDKKINELSLGNKKKVAIVQAMVNRPELLILDEPTNGLDPLVQHKLFAILKKEKERGTTIFLSSHNLVDVENLCDRVAVIKEGQIIDVIAINEEKQNQDINVIVVADELTEDLIREIGGKYIEIKNNEISFMYRKNINLLINELSKYSIRKLLISEKTLEEKFMNYYK